MVVSVLDCLDWTRRGKSGERAVSTDGDLRSFLFEFKFAKLEFNDENIDNYFWGAIEIIRYLQQVVVVLGGEAALRTFCIIEETSSAVSSICYLSGDIVEGIPWQGQAGVAEISDLVEMCEIKGEIILNWFCFLTRRTLYLISMLRKRHRISHRVYSHSFLHTEENQLSWSAHRQKLIRTNVVTEQQDANFQRSITRARPLLILTRSIFYTRLIRFSVCSASSRFRTSIWPVHVDELDSPTETTWSFSQCKVEQRVGIISAHVRFKRSLKTEVSTLENPRCGSKHGRASMVWYRNAAPFGVSSILVLRGWGGLLERTLKTEEIMTQRLIRE